MYYLTADGGGSKTEYALFRHDGSVVARYRSEGTNPKNIGISEVRKRLSDSVSALVTEAGIDILEIDKAIFFIPLIWHQPEIMEGLFPFATEYQSDTIAASAACLGNDDGVSVICGTGSCIIVHKGDNYSLYGGWGSTFGDEGSGYDIGKKALTLASRHFEIRKFDSPIIQSVKEHFHIESFEDMRFIQSNPDAFSTSQIASLCPGICALADAGNADALQILEDAAQGLLNRMQVAVIAEALTTDNLKIVFTGGAVTKNTILYEVYAKALQSVLPGVQVSLSNIEPIMGAMIYTLHHLDV